MERFAKIETYNDGIVYILVSNISSIAENESSNGKYTTITMNSGISHTVKCPIYEIWEILKP